MLLHNKGFFHTKRSCSFTIKDLFTQNIHDHWQYKRSSRALLMLIQTSGYTHYSTSLKLLKHYAIRTAVFHIYNMCNIIIIHNSKSHALVHVSNDVVRVLLLFLAKHVCLWYVDTVCLNHPARPVTPPPPQEQSYHLILLLLICCYFF